MRARAYLQAVVGLSLDELRDELCRVLEVDFFCRKKRRGTCLSPPGTPSRCGLHRAPREGLSSALTVSSRVNDQELLSLQRRHPMAHLGHLHGRGQEDRVGGRAVGTGRGGVCAGIPENEGRGLGVRLPENWGFLCAEKCPAYPEASAPFPRDPLRKRRGRGDRNGDTLASEEVTCRPDWPAVLAKVSASGPLSCCTAQGCPLGDVCTESPKGLDLAGHTLGVVRTPSHRFFFQSGSTLGLGWGQGTRTPHL